MRKSLLFLLLSFFVVEAGWSADRVQVYQIDPVHSNISFAVRHMMVSKVHGRFARFTGKIYFNETDVTRSKVEVTIDAASIETHNKKRDAELRSSGFLAVKQYPEIRFVSKKIEKRGDRFVAFGELTIRGVTRKVEIPFQYFGPIPNPMGGGKRLGAEGELTINRKDYGVNWSKTMDNGGLMVGNEVRIELSVEAVTQPQ